MATVWFIWWALAPLRPSTLAVPAKAETWGEAAFCLGFLLLAWRWPFLFAVEEFNPDESQMVAGAITLWRDPVFWQSVDGSTAGPLNFYALLWPKFLSLPIDYFTARLTGCVLAWVALLVHYRLLRKYVEAVPARLALLPVALFFSLTTQDDFVHYSTEQVSLALLGLAAFWLLCPEAWDGAKRPWRWWLGGLALGLLPWAKIQSIPLGGVHGAWTLWRLTRQTQLSPAQKYRRAAILLGSAAAPSAIFLLGISACGLWPAFLHRYVAQNFFYVAEQKNTLSYVYHWLQDSTHQTWHYQACVGAAVVLGISFSVIGRSQCWRQGPLWSLGLLSFGAAVFAVLTPHRPFAHYLFFTLSPLLLWSGAALAAAWHNWPGRPHRWALVLVSVGVGGLGPLALRLTQPTPAPLAEWRDNERYPRSAVGSLIGAYQRPQDRLAVWGWMCGLHVETGLAQGTRDGYSYWLIKPSPQQEEYRTTYLQDLRLRHPAFFVDAVGPGAFFFTERRAEAHETFPELAAYIRANYTEIIDLTYARLYVRKDRALTTQLDARQLTELANRGRNTRYEADPVPLSLDVGELPQNTFGGRVVRMMLPPAIATWTLRGTEREFQFECGYDPRAYLEGNGDGTDFVVSLQPEPGVTFPIFQRRLDPTHRLRDRGVVSIRVPLPPVTPGTKLLLRTTPGPRNDNAWDWAYLASASVLRSPVYSYQQFPGFNRLPDKAATKVAYLHEVAGQPVLVLHAPAELTFLLQGGERTLAFDYGFRPEAFSGNNRTDGANFILELHPRSGPVRQLWQHLLIPSTEPGHRRRQRAHVPLPELAGGDALILRITPGPSGSAAWDWTYLADLKIR